MRLALTLLLVLVAVARADTVVLDGGLTVQGIATTRGDKVEVRVPEGVLVYRRDVVRSITLAASPLHEYERRRAKLGARDAEGHYQLGLYCASQGLMGLSHEQMEQAVRIDPGHVGAHLVLGDTRLGKEWLCEFDYQQSQGNVRVDGAWVSREVSTAHDELRRIDSEVRAAAVAAYYQHLVEQESIAQSVEAERKTCNVDLSAKSAGPWLADALWETGSHLRIVFGDGPPELQDSVRRIAAEWTRYANLNFDFAVAGPDPSHDDIRITFAGDGAHSAVGRQSLEAARTGRPSMSLNPITHGRTEASWRRTILHEFGHALGMLHEHQNPNRTFHFNEEATRQYFSKLGLSPREIETNLLSSPVQGGPGGKAFDAQSIMLYELPPELTVEGIRTSWNTELSPVDKQVAAALYPGRAYGTQATGFAARGQPRADNRDLGHLAAALDALERDTRAVADRVQAALSRHRLGAGLAAAGAAAEPDAGSAEARAPRDLDGRLRGLADAFRAFASAFGRRTVDARDTARRAALESLSARSRQLASLATLTWNAARPLLQREAQASR